jgi:hypothetical protein
MPKKARKREPDEPVLATFMIAYEKWQQFQKVARAEGTTASATLVAFIESYLAGARFIDEEEEDESEPSSTSEDESNLNLEERIEQTVNVKIANVDRLLERLQDSVRDIDCRLEQVENMLPSGETTATEKPPKTIDIDAIAVDPDVEVQTARPFPSETSAWSPSASQTPQVNWENFGNVTAARSLGLSEQALCEEFGINAHNIERNANVRGISRQAYLHQLTGWLYRDGLYYPA